VAAAFQPEPANPFAKHALSPFVLEFLAGCVIAALAARGVRAGWRVARVGGLAVAVAGVAVTEANGLAMATDRVRVAVWGPAAALLVYGAVAAEGRWPRRVPGWLLRTGDASYSLSLTHWTVMLASVVLVGVRVPHTRVPHLLWLAGTLAAALVAGYAFHALVEKPLLGLVKRRRATPAAVPSDPVERPVRKAA
jgi:peptidoglycan/LPS O-acetylase OafA/YrhL